MNEREKEEMRNRKRELFDEQRKEKKSIQILQIQLKRTEEFEAWETSKKSEVNFIRTKGEVNPIYWLPKNHSEKTEALLSETKTAVEKELEEKKEAFEQELVGIEKRMMADLERRQQQFNNRRSNDGREGEGELDQSANGNGEEEGDGEDEGPGFMSGRVVVERREDLAKDDLRMMIRNEKNGDHEGRKRDHEEEKENLDSRRVVVKEEEEKERREEERRERRREEERKEGGGGRRVVRLDKSNGNERAESEENEERASKRPSSRNDREAEESAPPKKKSKEPTPETAEGEKKDVGP